VRLSILVPVYNEEATIATALKRMLNVDYPCDVEVLVVDDGSTDGTASQLAAVEDDRLVKHAHPVNRGKGAAVRTASKLATGEYVIVCDADLEYHPEEIPALLRPVLEGESRVVYGTRTFGSHSAYSFWYVVGNRVVTTAANVLFNCYLSDLETCFKLMPLSLLRDLDLRSSGFGLEAEITGKLLARGYRPFEVPISYRARTREEGKKITWKDGVQALWILTRIRSRRGGQGHRDSDVA
jgi:glycosyltransferase involved in cell wall biosynthesis